MKFQKNKDNVKQNSQQKCMEMKPKRKLNNYYNVKKIVKHSNFIKKLLKIKEEKFLLFLSLI